MMRGEEQFERSTWGRLGGRLPASKISARLVVADSKFSIVMQYQGDVDPPLVRHWAQGESAVDFLGRKHP